MFGIDKRESYETDYEMIYSHGWHLLVMGVSIYRVTTNKKLMIQTTEWVDGLIERNDNDKQPQQQQCYPQQRPQQTNKQTNTHTLTWWRQRNFKRHISHYPSIQSTNAMLCTNPSLYIQLNKEMNSISKRKYCVTMYLNSIVVSLSSNVGLVFLCCRSKISSAGKCPWSHFPLLSRTKNQYPNPNAIP